MKLLKFHTTWCGPCKQLNSMLDEALKTRPNIQVTHYDCEVDEEMKQKYEVKSVPLMFLLDDNDNIINTQRGLPSQLVLEQFLDSGK